MNSWMEIQETANNPLSQSILFRISKIHPGDWLGGFLFFLNYFQKGLDIKSLWDYIITIAFMNMEQGA